jgi:HD-like signal output (HDOD) protein
VEHSINTGLAARNIAEKIPGMDSEKAYILGILHDIGRRAGIVTIPEHINLWNQTLIFHQIILIMYIQSME